MAQNKSVCTEESSVYLDQEGNIRSLDFTWKKIANLLGFFTCFKEIEMNKETENNNYSNINYDNLDALVRNMS